MKVVEDLVWHGDKMQQFPNFTTAGPVSWKKMSLRVGVGGGGFRMIQVYYVYCALYLNYDYISSISDHQALDPRS